MNQHRALIVGLGRIGWRGFDNPAVETHYGTLSTHPHISVVGGIDSDDSTRLAFQESTHLPVYTDIDAAITDTAADIVVVASPAETHAEMVCKAALHDCVRGILCEKPMSTSVDECSRMAVACYRKNKVLVIGHQRRYEQNHRLVRAFIRSGALGDLVGGRCVFPGRDYLNNGSHAADVMRFLVGDDIPFTIRLGGENTRVFAATVACKQGNITIESYGKLVAGYMQTMYNDLVECMESDRRPECGADDGTEAVRLALAAEEMWNEAVA